MASGMVNGAADVLCMETAEGFAAAEESAERCFRADTLSVSVERAADMTNAEAVLTSTNSDVRPGLSCCDYQASERVFGTDDLAGTCEIVDARPLPYRFVKRLFDVVFSIAVIAVGFIPGVLLSALIIFDTKGSPIYSQERVGRFGRPFRIYKFRTMVADADDVEKYLSPEQLAEWRRERKVGDDPRITKLGKVLRKTSLDELPQFLNVLLGQLSVVGPRAVTFDELSHYGVGALKLLSVPQGITGAWQVGLRNDATFENGERQRIELGYVENASMREDSRIFLATFGAMFGKERSGR